MRKLQLSIFLLLALCVSLATCGQKKESQPANNGTINVIPQPLEMSVQAGTFKINSDTKIYADRDATQVADLFAKTLRLSTGFALPVSNSIKPEKGICFVMDKKSGTLGKEGYRLTVSPDNITVMAANAPGLFYGAQTLRQLLPAQVESQTKIKGTKWVVPCVTVCDTPRFNWRGYMKDVSRTFYSVDVLKKYMDVMALYKMNVLHLHLTDDQGWRIEIKKYPKLTTPLTTVFAPVHKQPAERSGFYTQEQIKDLVKYATERNITLVPEIDVPGHSWATLLVYPELGVNDKHDPGHVFPFLASWGYWGTQFTPNTLDPTKENVYQFLDDVFTEITELFPGDYIHFGGDEVRHSCWDAEPHVTKFIKEHNLENSTGLQNYFVARVCRIIKSKGKKPIGWNDILQNPDNLTKETAIMSWLGSNAITKAAQNGFYTVAAPTYPMYFDITQADRNDGTMTDLAYGSINGINVVYNYDPTRGLDEAQQRYVLGIQGNLWTAVSQNVKDMNVQNFPRLIALAENAWSAKQNKDFADFTKRLEKTYDRLDELKIDYYRPGGYITGTWKPEQLTTAFSLLEWDVTPKVYADGRIMAGFYHTGGKNFMDIRKVELLENGKVVSTDEHTGLADEFRGTHKTKTYVYNLALDKYNPKAKYTIRAEVKGNGGTESSGNFTFNLSPYKPFTVVEPRK